MGTKAAGIRLQMNASAAVLAIALLVAPSASFASETRRSSSGTAQTGMGACYSRRLVGHRTTSGERYDPNALTAAHHKLPVETEVKVTNVGNGESVVVKVNDHLGARRGTIIDLSKQACSDLKFPRGGKARVKVEAVSKATPQPR